MANIKNASLDAVSFPVSSEDVGFIQNGASAIARSAQDKLRDFVSVKDFGAMGDGATDDYSAIQSAIAYCNTFTYGACLVFPPGTYLVSDTLRFQKTADKQVCVLGYGAHLTRFGDFTGSLMYFGEPTNTVSVTPPFLIGLTLFNAYLTPAVSPMLSLQNANGMVLRDCVFQAAQIAVEMDSSYAVRFDNCKFINQATYCIIASTACMNLLVHACQFGNSAASGVGAAVYLVETTYNVKIIDNDFEKGVVGIFINAPSGSVVIRGNYFEAYTGLPVYVGATTSALEVCGNWFGYNSAQTWYNVKGGTLSHNIFYDQQSAVDPSCEGFEIGQNALQGSSNHIAAPWTAPSLGNSFSNVGGSWEPAGYMKLSNGLVLLRGVVRASADQVPFVLPTGYRPSGQKIFPALGADGTPARVTIGSDGSVVVVRANDGSCDLGSVSFMSIEP